MESDKIKRGRDHAPARAMLRATGLDDDRIAAPLVAVVNTWSEVTPCNLHLRDLAEPLKDGIREAGGTPIEFNTVMVSDGIAMGSEGMHASLMSRETIADSIELAVRGHCLDAVIVLVGCDKTIPAAAMALARLDRPGLVLYGGSIMPGRVPGEDGDEIPITIQDVFEAVGSHAAGRIDDDRLEQIEKAACPGAGACGGQFTANTMATCLTLMGIAPMGANDVPAADERKAQVAFDTGAKEEFEEDGVEWYDGGIGFAIPLESINRVLGQLDSLKHPNERVLRGFKREVSARLFDLREIWLRVMQDCRDENRRRYNDRD